MTWNRAMSALGSAFVACVLICAITPAPNLVGRRMEVRRAEAPADAVVVLGAGMMADGTLNNESMRRMMQGLLLYKEGLAPLIVFTGPARRAGMSESEVRAHIAETFGVPVRAIVSGIEANTTREEAEGVSAALRPRGLSKVLLVTASLHMRRAKAVFERAGLQVFADPSDDLPEVSVSPFDRLALTVHVASESAALLYYKLAGFY